MPSTDSRRLADVADRLFDAIERGDIAMVTAVVERRRHGLADRRRPRQRQGAGAEGHPLVHQLDHDRRYEILDRQFFDGGFVQQHVLHATGRNGESIAMRVCIVIKVGADGLITRIDEYFDPVEMAPLLDYELHRGRNMASIGRTFRRSAVAGVWRSFPSNPRSRCLCKSMWGVVPVKGPFKEFSGDGQVKAPQRYSGESISRPHHSAGMANATSTCAPTVSLRARVPGHQRGGHLCDAIDSDAVGLHAELTIKDTTKPLHFAPR